VPVAWPDAPDGCLSWEAGLAVVVVGRVRRRFFRAGGATVSRTEVVAQVVAPARQRVRASRALHGAAELLADAAGQG
jgi:single-strand DNA-binding protein